MSYLGFKYCPFCGSHIPQNNKIKYCPFCGVSLLVSDNKKQDDTLPDKKSIPQDVISQQVIDIGKREDSEINLNEYYKTSPEKFIESEYYSIVLKYVSTKQSLVSKLEKIMLRGSFAIRLAIDNIPSIIVYKAKGKDIVDFKRIFAEEQASVSIITGDFNSRPAVEEIFHSIGKLSMKAREILVEIPVELWLGDTILGMFPHAFRENKEGFMIISDQNIYFIYQDPYAKEYRWFVISYSLLLKIGIQNNDLQFIYRNHKTASITFADRRSLVNAYQCLSNFLQNSN